MADPITISGLATTGRVDVRDPNLGQTFSLLNANFSGVADITVDFGVQSQGQTFGVARSMFLDNGTNPSPVEVTVSGTDQFFTIPAFSIGYYTIDANAASRVQLVTVGGASDICTVIFYNWPRDPVVWYSFGAFNTDRPIKAEGPMSEGAVVATEEFKNPVFIGGIDRATGEFRGVGVDALGRLDFSSTINVGGVFGADLMGAAPINPGFTQAVLNSAGVITYVSLNAAGEFVVHDADVLAKLTDILAALSGSTNPASSTITSVPDAVADTLILASNVARKGATVYNDSTEILYLVVDNSTATTTNFTVKMQPEAYYEVPFSYTGEIRGIWAANAAGSARVTEIS